MIVRMSKIEIIGPRDLLMPSLERLRELEVLQIEDDATTLIERGKELPLRSLMLDQDTLSKRLSLEQLHRQFNTLLSTLPKHPGRTTYLSPQASIDTLARVVEDHIANCARLSETQTEHRSEIDELERLRSFLAAIAPLVRDAAAETDLEFIGLELKDPSALSHLNELVALITDHHYHIETAPGPEGTLLGLITAQRETIDQIKDALRDERMPDFPLPEDLAEVPFPKKLAAVESRIRGLEDQQRAIGEELEAFAVRWRPLYEEASEWIRSQLELLQKSTHLYETAMCFFIIGWIPSADLPQVRSVLAADFHDQVVIVEKEILERDLDRVPVALKNPPYFQPFELFSRLLPLPRYASFDPTTFIGLFFPLFFGMILGDIGYGLLLLGAALALVTLVKRHQALQSAGKILGVCAGYTIIFGWFYGECFGELGHELFGIEPLCFDRRTAIVPMLYFALAVGVVHVSLGMALGMISALRQKKAREAMVKALFILAILCIILFLSTHLLSFAPQARRPLLVAVGIIVAALTLIGGLLAPLELLKSFGNIISYARIMAVGLTSVLLAYVANELSGSLGDIFLGIVAAVMLHAFNLLLGVFAPTIHSLRLHYVEFFGKFLETGGRKYDPMKK